MASECCNKKKKKKNNFLPFAIKSTDKFEVLLPDINLKVNFKAIFTIKITKIILIHPKNQKPFILQISY
jgi:hypothetical protein